MGISGTLDDAYSNTPEERYSSGAYEDWFTQEELDYYYGRIEAGGADGAAALSELNKAYESRQYYHQYPAAPIPAEIRQYYKKSSELMRRQSDIAELQEDQASLLWKKYRNLYLGKEGRWARAAFAGLREDQLRAEVESDMGAAWQRSDTARAENLRSLGMDPNDPKFAQYEKESELARAAAEAGARNQVRSFLRDYNTNLATQAIGLGRGVVPMSQQYASQALGGLAAAGQTGALGAQQYQQAWQNQVAQGQYAAQSANQWAMQNAQMQAQAAAQPSTLQKGASGAVAGAMLGSYFGPPGIAAGAAGGFLLGAFS